MLFKIIDGKPYLFSHEKLYRASVSASSVSIGDVVELSGDNPGLYTVAEILAKCSTLSSMEEKKPARQKKTE
ncbi:hypothetical protein [Kineothrix sedimenti]|uniref:Uncharacterized protein n=1 Tax=Kineothrix sedimenti TaxID=3123317 RepID=A0ABZ3ETW2_9FIRM